MASFTAEDIALGRREHEAAERLGAFLPANDPGIQGVGSPNPCTVRRDGMIIDYDVPIPIRDGTVLRGNIFRNIQQRDEKLPVLLNYSVYGKDDILEISMFPTSSRLDKSRTSTYYTFEATDALWWTQRGYAIAVVDARGSFKSDGNKHFYSRDVGIDGHDVVEWLGAQPWSSGKVGLYGASAFAMVQWLIAAERPPCLEAILPFDGMTDIYREMARKGGMPETQFMKIYPFLFNWGRGLVEDSENSHINHPFFDEYWKSKVPALSRITCPAYVVCGWGDHGIHTRGTLNGWKQISSKHKFLEIHGFQKWEYALTQESLFRQKAFFDSFLLGASTEVQFWPPVRYAMREAFYDSEWRFTDSFPFPGTDYRRFYPTLSGGLADTHTTAPQNVSYDAASGEARLELPILESLEFAGHAKLRLWVEAQGSNDMDIFVTLRKTDSTGKQVNFPFMTIANDGPVAFGWLRASRRELDLDKTTDIVPYHLHAREIPLEEGQVVPVDIEILPTSCRLRAGDRLQVVISGHDYGQYPSTIPIPRHETGVNKGRHIIHFGGGYDSYLQLPVLPPVEQSLLRHGRSPKMVMAANRLTDKAWSDEEFLQEYTGVHANMVQQLSLVVPFLRSYTQVVDVPKHFVRTFCPHPPPFEVCTILAWSSLVKLHASFQHPNYKASAEKHEFTDLDFKGSICQTWGEIMFDPIRYERRSNSIVVVVLIPRNQSTLPQGQSAPARVLQDRLQTLRRVGAGTELLRYVLNEDITPAEPNDLFAGTLFENADWGDVAVVEQYWFGSTDEAARFFKDKERLEILGQLPDSFDKSRMLSVLGKENRVVFKDLEF